MRLLSPDLSFILRGIKRSAALLSALSIVGALCEAFLLTALVQSIATLRDGHHTLHLHFGPVHLSGRVSVVLAFAVGTAVVRAAVSASVALLGPRIAARTRARQRRLIYAAYMRADWPTQSQEKTGQLMQTFSSSVNDATSLVLLATQAVPALFTLSVVLLVAFVLSPLVTLVIAAVGLSTSMLLLPVSRSARQAAKLDARGRNATAAHVSGSLMAGAEISVMGARQGIIRDAHQRIDRTERQFGRSQGFKRFVAVAGQSLTFVVAALGVWILSISHADVDFAIVGTIAILMLRAAGLTQQIQSTLSQYGTIRPFVEQVRTMIEKYDANRPVFGTQQFPDDFAMDLEDVSYTYPGSTLPALRVDRLRLPAGVFVGVMGPSGAGKSTLIQVLLRLRSPTEGVVRIGGLDIGEIGDAEFSRHVAYVPQASHLLTGTVMDNILFYRDWLDVDDAVDAARRVNLHDEIMEMPQGYNTSMDGHVAPLSGGQKQRLSLARALASKPRLLVLDEPTSALDADNEQIVLSVLAGLSGSTTVVMITHKRAAVDGCDRVLVVDQGVLSEVPHTGRGQEPPTDGVELAADVPR